MKLLPSLLLCSIPLLTNCTSSTNGSNTPDNNQPETLADAECEADGDCVAAEVINQYQIFWDQLYNDFSVTGGAGIEQFCKATLQSCLMDGFWEEEKEMYTLDPSNAYFHYFSEGSGHLSLTATYWNRTDKTKLFMISYDTSEFSLAECDSTKVFGTMSAYNPWLRYNVCGDINTAGAELLHVETGFLAWTYDEAKKQLVRLENPPFNGLDTSSQDNSMTHYQLELPQQGKDITVKAIVYDTNDWRNEPKVTTHRLKWNGMTFDYLQ